MKQKGLIVLLYSIFMLLCPKDSIGMVFRVVDILPEQNENSADTSANITIFFSSSVDFSTIQGNLFVRSDVFGLISVQYSQLEDSVIRCTPETPFYPGDVIQVTLTSQIQNNDGVQLKSFTYSFNIKTKQANGNFTQYQACSLKDRIDSFFAADFDKDGDVDIVYGVRDANEISILRNEGSLIFRDNRDPRTLVLQANGVNFIDAADINNDGYLDIIASLNNIGFVYFLNDQLGAFNPNYKRINPGPRNIFGARSVHASDIDNDGDVDILGTDNTRLLLYINQGIDSSTEDIDFTEITIADDIGGGEQIIATDLIGNDGRLEIIVAAQSAGQIVTFQYDESDEEYNHNAAFEVDDIEGASSVYAIDVNKDKAIDIIASAIGDNKVILLENEGTNLKSPIDLDTDATQASFVHAGDVYGEGFIDILAGTRRVKNLAIYRNIDGGNFSESEIKNTIDGTETAYLVDLDGDGDLDIVASSITDGQVYWYINDDVEVLTPIQGKDTVCTNEMITYSTLATPGYTYFWSAENGTIEGANSSGIKAGDTIQVMWTAPSGRLFLEADSDCKENKDTISVFAITPSDIDINGRFDPVCLGESEVYTLENNNSQNSSDNIYWELEEGKGRFVDGINSGNEVEIEWLEPGETTIIANQIDQNSCSNSRQEVINIVPPPTINNLIGNTQVCLEGDSKLELYTIPATSDDSFFWEAEGGQVQGANNQNFVQIIWERAPSHKLILTKRSQSTRCDNTKNFDIVVLKKHKLLSLLKLLSLVWEQQ